MILLPPGNSPKSTFEPSENTNTKVRMNLRTLSLISYHLHYFPPLQLQAKIGKKNKTSFIPKLSQPLSGVTSNGVSTAEADAADFELPK